MSGKARLRRAACAALALSIALVCVPALADEPGSLNRQKLPPLEEKVLYNRSDLKSESGVTEMPDYVPAPVVIEPGGGLLDSGIARDLGGIPGAALILGGSGPSDGLDPIASAERSMRKTIRRLD